MTRQSTPTFAAAAFFALDVNFRLHDIADDDRDALRRDADVRQLRDVVTDFSVADDLGRQCLAVDDRRFVTLLLERRRR